MIDRKRRLLLKTTLATGTVALAAGAGLLKPTVVFASRPETAFEAESVEAAIEALYGAGAATESGEIELKAPEIAENGAVVPITIKTSLTGVDSIGVLIAGNGHPMGAELKLTPRAIPMFSTRVKVAKSSKVIAVVKQGDKVFSASRDVKVTVGGCGG
jgi:sulfur-oxidizing protein SoxY